MFWNKTEVVVARYYECLNATELFTLKWLIYCSLNFTFCILWIKPKKADTKEYVLHDSISEQALPWSDWKGQKGPSGGPQMLFPNLGAGSLQKIQGAAPFLNKRLMAGLPWWHSGWESACQCRGHGFEPWCGRIPHATEQLGLWATTTEPAHLESVLRNKRGRDSERPAHRDEEWPPLATTRESPHTETKTQHSQK